MSNYDVEVILKEMFKRVGLEYSPSFTSQEDWFLEASWTHYEEACFKEWLIRFLKTKHHFTKARAENEATWIILHCGWATKTPTEATDAI